VEPLELPVGKVPAPDRDVEPGGYLLDGLVRIHFLDWTGSEDTSRLGPATASPVVLVHGFGATAWSWAAVARRLHGLRRVIAVDLRGHGLSDAPTDGYDLETLAADVEAVATAIGLADGSAGICFAGHGFGANVAATCAARLGDRCSGLVLIDGGWERLAEATGLDPDEFLRGLDEPPEVLRSMSAFLADRAAFDPATWDADQERAARASVVELPAGHVEPAIQPHVRVACVEAMFAYDPVATLARLTVPIGILTAADDEDGTHARTLASTAAALAARGRPPLLVTPFAADGHNLLRYRPAEVVAAILALGGA
jgi:pimeloyl-ACP methyl ester carboxylesterase